MKPANCNTCNKLIKWPKEVFFQDGLCKACRKEVRDRQKHEEALKLNPGRLNCYTCNSELMLTPAMVKNCAYYCYSCREKIRYKTAKKHGNIDENGKVLHSDVVRKRKKRQGKSADLYIARSKKYLKYCIEYAKFDEDGEIKPTSTVGRLSDGWDSWRDVVMDQDNGHIVRRRDG